MHVKYAAGTVLAVTSTLVSGVQWAGVNIAGFDFGCDIQVGGFLVSFLLSRLTFWKIVTEDLHRAIVNKMPSPLH